MEIGKAFFLFMTMAGATACYGIECEPGTYGYTGRQDRIYILGDSSGHIFPETNVHLQFAQRRCDFQAGPKYSLEPELPLLKTAGVISASGTLCELCNPGSFSNFSGETSAHDDRCAIPHKPLPYPFNFRMNKPEKITKNIQK